MTGPELAILANRRILVAEDEYMIATEIAEVLADHHAKVIGPAPGVSEALDLLAGEERVDAAMVDVNLRGEFVWPLVDALLRRGIPVMLATGYDASVIPPAYAQLPRFEKPASANDLVRALARALIAAAPA